jgi:hypothetical protein
MSLTRTQLALVALLGLQIALIAAFSWPGTGRTSGTEPRPWLPDLDAEQVSAVVIEDDQDRTVELRRAGEEWTLPERDDFPVEAGRVAELLDKLAEIRVRAPVVQQEEFHESLEVTGEAFRRRVILLGEDPSEPIAELFIGTSPQYQIHHARRATEDAVYEITGLSTSDLRAEPAEWARPGVVDVDASRVVRLELENEHGAFVLARDGEQAEWKVVEPAGRSDTALDTASVEELIERIGRLRVAKPVGAIDEQEQGFASPVATVRLLTEQREIIVRVGGSHLEETSQRYLTASTLEHAITVWDSAVEPILSAELAGLGKEES